jgi:hypothetical protein
MTFQESAGAETEIVSTGPPVGYFSRPAHSDTQA